MSSLVFLPPDDLGDAVLSLGALDFVRTALGAPDVLVAARWEACALFLGMEGVRCVWWRAPGERLLKIAQFARSHVFSPADAVLDLSGVGAAVRAKRRFTLKPARALRHRLEDYAEAVGASGPLPPRLRLTDAARNAARAAAPGPGPLLVLAPAAPRARWPAEKFAAIARRLQSGPLAECEIILLGGGEDASVGQAISASLSADGVRVNDQMGRFDLLDCAALLERATLFIGHDGALMQIAAAAGAPTLALFGATDERVSGPQGPRSRVLRSRPFADVARSGDEEAAFADLSVDAVEAAAIDLLRAGGV